VVFFRSKSRLRQTLAMEVQVQNRGSGCCVSASGRITIDSSPELLSVLLQNLSIAGPASLTLDLSDVTYIDTSALAVFLEALKAAHDLKKSFHLSGLCGRPRYLLEATGFIRLFSKVAQETSA
jgi:anti-sigma B factor antagonist